MHEDDGKTRPIYRNLDTAYVNLAALLRYLREREFCGRVHVLLDEYEAEVFLEGDGAQPHVEETDHAAGRRAEGDAALQRLLVRSREPGGQITVYAESTETEALEEEALPSTRRDAQERSLEEPEEITWRDVQRLSGELIAAVERAALSFGADFTAIFGNARLELADDFPLLDPSARRFHYAHGTVSLSVEPEVKTYLSGVSETLRRVVDRLAAAKSGRSVRERVALELAVLARRREAAIKQLKMMPYLERIAGTKVL